MINLIRHDLKLRLWFIPGSLIVLEMIARMTKSYEFSELGFYLYPIICCCLLFGSETEIELIRTSNTRLSSVLFMRYFMTYLFTVWPAAARLLLLGTENDLRNAVTLATTLLFATSFSLLFRVICTNPYAAVLFSLMVHAFAVASFKLLLVKLFGVSTQKALQRFNPYDTAEISNKAVYINNRLIVVGAALAVIALAYLLTRRREKLYTE